MGHGIHGSCRRRWFGHFVLALGTILVACLSLVTADHEAAAHYACLPETKLLALQSSGSGTNAIVVTAGQGTAAANPISKVCDTSNANPGFTCVFVSS